MIRKALWGLMAVLATLVAGPLLPVDPSAPISMTSQL